MYIYPTLISIYHTCRCFLRQYGGAWPCFAVSLGMIGGMTAVVEALGGLLGCVLGIKASVAGITIIALGTSLPDTFASRTAALHDAGADAAIGNVTGMMVVHEITACPPAMGRSF
jgi:Ca2+/Na+ antiporter